MSKNETKSNVQFWDEKWNANEIGFHLSTINPFLERNLNKLILENPKARILFPFSGKEIDMAWLATLGHEIVGVEYVQKACEQFFEENKIKYSLSEVKNFKLFTSENKKIKIYCGDFFNFTTEYESPFEYVWDRGAFGALPSNLRIRYAEHIQKLLATNFRYLLNVFDYDPELYPGPPHSVKVEEIQNLYGTKCKVEFLESVQHRPFNKKLEEANQPHEKLYILTNY